MSTFQNGGHHFLVGFGDGFALEEVRDVRQNRLEDGSRFQVSTRRAHPHLKIESELIFYGPKN